MDLHERHGSCCSDEDREDDRTQVLATDPQRIGRFRWDWRRSVHARVAKASHDVLRFDARPHHSAEVGELGAHLCQLDGQCLLRGIELVCAIEQRLLFGSVAGSFGWAVRQPAVSVRLTWERRHELPLACSVIGGSDRFGW